MVSTRLRWRVFRPWIEKPCSRVLRKLSGELTTIQYCAVRPPPDFRLRLDRPDLAGRSCSAVWVSGASEVSALSLTDGSLLAVSVRGVHGAEVLGLRQESAEVADLADVPHLVARDEAAHLEQRHHTATWVGDRAVPFGLSPTGEEIHGPAAHPREVLQRLLERPRQLLVLAGSAGRPGAGGRVPRRERGRRGTVAAAARGGAV